MGGLQIGFVSYFLVGAGHLVCANWVRFAYLGRWEGGGGVNWVRFVFFDGWRWGIGFVSHFGAGKAGETPAGWDWVRFA